MSETSPQTLPNLQDKSSKGEVTLEKQRYILCVTDEDKIKYKVCVLGEEAGGFLTVALGVLLAQKGESNLVSFQVF